MSHHELEFERARFSLALKAAHDEIQWLRFELALVQERAIAEMKRAEVERTRLNDRIEQLAQNISRLEDLELGALRHLESGNMQRKQEKS